MKKTILTLFLSFFSLPSLAVTGFYFGPSLSAGQSQLCSSHNGKNHTNHKDNHGLTSLSFGYNKEFSLSGDINMVAGLDMNVGIKDNAVKHTTKVGKNDIEHLLESTKHVEGACRLGAFIDKSIIVYSKAGLGYSRHKHKTEALNVREAWDDLHFVWGVGLMWKVNGSWVLDIGWISKNHKNRQFKGFDLSHKHDRVQASLGYRF